MENKFTQNVMEEHREQKDRWSIHVTSISDGK